MKPNPKKQQLMSELKPAFIERYKSICPNYDEFIDCSFTFLRRSVRINTLKKPIKEVKASLQKQGWQLKQIPWCKQGFWVEHKTGRRDIGNTLEHQLGYIYVQEAVSMIPPIVLQPKPGEVVLDMCAAPGSKTSQIAQYMENKGVLISNDYKGMRLKPLGLNIQRCGITNSIITLMEGRWFKDMQFDKILVDAPCSGTGTIRKSLKTINIWNPNMIRRLAAEQKQLIETGFNNLKQGGTLVYSTCSLEPEEDEAIVSFLLDKFDNAEIEPIKLKGLKSSKPIMEFNGTKYNPKVKDCLRLWPQDNDSEGFFVAKLRKI